MAVSKMKKLSVVTMREDTDSLMLALQKLRCVDLITLPPEEDDFHTQPDLTARTAAENTAIARCKQAIDFLSQYHTKNRSLFTPLQEIPLEEEHDAAGVAENACALEDELRRTQHRLSAVKNEQAALEPWRSCTLVLPSSSTAFTKSVCGTLPGAVSLESLKTELAAYACVFTVENGDKAQLAVSLVVHRDEYEDVMRLMTGYGFAPVAVKAGEKDGFAAGKLTSLAAEQVHLEEECAQLRKKAGEMAAHLGEIEIYYDHLTTAQARTDAVKCVHFTGKAAVLTGWVPEKQTDKVTALLDSRDDAYEFTDPEPDEEVPVLLDNNRFASSFEPVVGLYSLPAYGTFDPTFIMSFFYIVIFGLMFADVGYGVLLVIACLGALKLMKPEGSLRKFFTMFAICGVSMTVMGVIFGGYFGDLPTQIHTNFFGGDGTFAIPSLVNPLSDPMTFLVISIIMGAIHLFTALGVKFYVLCRSGDPLAAVFDAGSWMLVFLGAGLAIVGMLVLEPLMTVGIVVLVIGLLMLICTQGRHEKNPVMKVLKGIMSLYDIVSYISDLLSYSRILSLGLASAVIASVFNIIGTMAGPSVIGILLLVVVGTVGHVMNLAINLLGTFVHTSRLQYIEFFGKFYEDGGKPFVPLAPQSKYVRFR